MTFPDLLAEADRYARMTMKRHGKLAPVMMAATPAGLILFTPDGLTDTGMKDDFASKVKLITASHQATAVVLIVESWLTRARPDQPLDQTPPSESLDREEVVVLIGQAQSGEHHTHFLPIHRLGNGKFWNLGDAEDMPADSFKGRFSGLLPPKPVDEKTRQMGKVLLEAMGVKVTPLKGR
jgi:hypothetical protein